MNILFRPVLEKSTLHLIVLSFIAVILFGIAVSFWRTSSEDARMREDLLVLTRTAAQSINLERLNNLNGSPADLDSTDYHWIKNQLIVIRKDIPKCRFIYLLGRHPDGAIYFFVDSEPADSEDYSPPGQLFFEADESIHYIFDTRQGIVDGPTTDRWGTWVSGFTPLFDSETGELLAVFGMDIDSKDWQQRVIFYSAAPVSIALLLAVLLAFSFVLYLLAKREKRFFMASEAALRKYEHIVSSNPHFMSFIDRNYTFQVINDAYLNAFDKQREDIIGHTLAELYGKEFFLNHQKKPFDKALSGQETSYET